MEVIMKKLMVKVCIILALQVGFVGHMCSMNQDGFTSESPDTPKGAQIRPRSVHLDVKELTEALNHCSVDGFCNLIDDRTYITPEDIPAVIAILEILENHDAQLQMLNKLETLEIIESKSAHILEISPPGTVEQDDQKQEVSPEVSLKEMIRRVKNLNTITAHQLDSLKMALEQARQERTQAEEDTKRAAEQIRKLREALAATQRKLDVRARESFGGGCHDGCCGFLKLLWNNTTCDNCCLLDAVKD
jgi:hypothetical protein